MIRKNQVELQSFIESQEEFFKEFQLTVSEVLVANSKRVGDDPKEPKEVTDTRNMEKTITDKFNAEPTIVIPGVIVQWLIPKKEMIVTMVFVKDGNDTRIQLDIIPLTTVRPEIVKEPQPVKQPEPEAKPEVEEPEAKDTPDDGRE